MTTLLPTTRSLCWLSFNALFKAATEGHPPNSSPVHEKPEITARTTRQRRVPQKAPVNSSPTDAKYRNTNGIDSSTVKSAYLQNGVENHSSSLKQHHCQLNESYSGKKSSVLSSKDSKAGQIMGAIKCGSVCWYKHKSDKNDQALQDGLSEKGRCSCRCTGLQSYDDNENLESTSSSGKKKVLNFSEAPFYLKFNPYITGGYRGSLSPLECIKSVFAWNNETVNIWTHFSGWMFFFGLTLYDSLGLTDMKKTQPWDQTVITLLLICFQACMLLSSLYHIFCCCSEKYYKRWLSADLFGVSLSLLAIYVSGIYYAFSCVPFWLNFYLVTVGAIFASAMAMQVIPMVRRDEQFQYRLLVFGGWAAYGIIPTAHWAVLHGGMSNSIVALLLPRIVGVYLISAAAFFFYVSRLPERIFPGVVNYFGSSHQLWHVLIVWALYHWHNTGILYLTFRAEHPCEEEYQYVSLF